MEFTWIFRRNSSLKRWLLTCTLVLFSSPFISCDGPVRPMLISLPINVRASIPIGQNPFYETEESAEEQRVDQRILPRGNNDSPQDYTQEDNDSDARPQPGFISWNPGSKFMLLQINDYIGARSNNNEEENTPAPTDSEEFEKVEDTLPRKQRRKPPKEMQDFPDMEEHRRILEPRRRPSGSSRKSKSLEGARRMKYVEQSAEEDDVYDPEPLIHYLSERKKRKKSSSKPSAYDDIQKEESHGFNFRDWWGDY